jgi:hypothetical protein
MRKVDSIDHVWFYRLLETKETYNNIERRKYILPSEVQLQVDRFNIWMNQMLEKQREDTEERKTKAAEKAQTQATAGQESQPQQSGNKAQLDKAITPKAPDDIELSEREEARQLFNNIIEVISVYQAHINKKAEGDDKVGKTSFKQVWKLFAWIIGATVTFFSFWVVRLELLDLLNLKAAVQVAITLLIPHVFEGDQAQDLMKILLNQAELIPEDKYIDIRGGRDLTEL